MQDMGRASGVSRRGVSAAVRAMPNGFDGARIRAADHHQTPRSDGPATHSVGVTVLPRVPGALPNWSGGGEAADMLPLMRQDSPVR